MFSDFSLKALIKDWDKALLGPNPFVKVGEFSGKLILSFDCSPLKHSPSAQLAIVGNLSDTDEGHGSVHMNAMSGTIAYTITDAAAELLDLNDARPYTVQVLTVAEELSNANYTSKLIQRCIEKNWNVCSSSGVRGLAGHVLISYPPSQMNLRRTGEYGEDVPRG